MTRKSNRQLEVWTVERCYITELLNSADQPEVSLARTRVEPGVTTQLHQLSVDEWYVIERGEGLMRVGDERLNLGLRCPLHADSRIDLPGEQHSFEIATSRG